MGILIGVVAAVVLLLLFVACCYKVVEVDKALIITGGKEPVIKISGGAFVIPFIRKADKFDLCMLTVPADGDEIKTKTAVPIVVDWTAQIRPNTDDTQALKKAIVSFKERGTDGIIDDVKLTLMGAVRGVVATMTPEQVQNDKETFKEAIVESVTDELSDMGLKLVSLNIQDIVDNNGYYDNIAAIDMAEKKREAEKKVAIVSQEIRSQTAESNKIAAQNELDARLAVAEKQRDNDLKEAEFKAQTDKAAADAAIAGELQRTIRQQEIAEQQGRVAVVQQEQANLAALKEKEVTITRAEAEKEQKRINAEAKAHVQKVDAEAQANIQKIEAEAKVAVAEKQANAVKIEAKANAEKVRQEGEAAADVTREKGIAEAEVIKQAGLAEVEIIRNRGLAEAEAIRAKGLAEAEAEAKLAEARAGHDKVNFEIEKLKIEAEARIAIATKTAEVMASVGQNAEFVNIGGSGPAGGTGNVLIDTLAALPGLMKTLNVQNNALNGQPINDEISGLVGSITDPMKGLLINNTTPNKE